MATSRAARSDATRNSGWLPALLVGGRIVGAGLTAAMGWIHLDLWVDGYREIPTIGTLFLLNGIGAALLAIALLGTPTRWLAAASGLGALFTAGTLAALIASLTVGVFGFVEYWEAPLVLSTVVVESAGTVVLAGLATVSLSRRAR